jgi:YCII-related domain
MGRDPFVVGVKDGHGSRSREGGVMADFVLLYSGGSMPETDEERAQVMKLWDAWFAEIGGALKDGGNPFAPAAKTVGADGSVADAKPQYTGYSIVTAGSLDEATKIAKGSPVLHGGATVTVHETFEVM